jgi:diaminobutyrate-2-oxoglutarate transaminase
METAGPESNVAKVMPPLTIDEVALKEGLDVLARAVSQVAREAAQERRAEYAAR